MTLTYSDLIHCTCIVVAITPTTGWLYVVTGLPTGGGGGGGNWGILLRAPGRSIKGPLNTCLKDRYTLIEQSDLDTLTVFFRGAV